MTPATSSALIKSFVDYFSGAQEGVLGGIVYEMFGLEDAFGRVMLNNLQVPPNRYYFDVFQDNNKRFDSHGMSSSLAPSHIRPQALSPDVFSSMDSRKQER
jgi:[phosphatase 2A protein]-leucine-carboxy methyltransferase